MCQFAECAHYTKNYLHKKPSNLNGIFLKGETALASDIK